MSPRQGYLERGPRLASTVIPGNQRNQCCGEPCFLDQDRFQKCGNLPNLRVYSGEEPWREFYLQFRQMMNLQGWSNEMAAQCLVFYLKGAALTYYTLIPDEERSDLDKVVQALSQRFGRVVTAETQRTRFYALSQRDNESLIDFSDRVKAVARDAFGPGEVSSSYVAKEIMSTFLRGLTDMELTRYGAILELKDMGELLTKLLTYCETMQRPPNPTRPKLRSVTFKDDNSESEEEIGRVRQLSRTYSNLPKRGFSSSTYGGQTDPLLTQMETGQSQLLASMGEIKTLLQGLTQMLQSQIPQEVKHFAGEPGGLVYLQGLAGGRVPATLLQDARISLGSHECVQPLYVADMLDDMLLGLDILEKWGAVIDLRSLSVNIEGETVPAAMLMDGEGNTLSIVSVAKRIKIPAATSLTCEARLSTPMRGSWLMTPLPSATACLIPATLHRSASEMVSVICLINDSNVSHVLEAGTVVGLAEPVRVLDVSDSEGRIRQVVSRGSEQIPAHLVDLHKRSQVNLTAEQKSVLEDLLREYAEVFAAHDLDLGYFQAIQHEILTEDLLPIRDCFRRKPQGFEHEEEKTPRLC